MCLTIVIHTVNKTESLLFALFCKMRNLKRHVVGDPPYRSARNVAVYLVATILKIIATKLRLSCRIGSENFKKR